ncbi:hypothetical protein FHR51_002526 [Xanthomonas arboricola]|uniref:hypothetical protein n=1 Tax=Xanthomonas cannabis TaxID=1885674 RepID=UPI001612CDE1|nr:hypothetical protein [Xanthomonas cannabis]MBB3806374.1 hypothetical protein [Xanthomonas cannabis]
MPNDKPENSLVINGFVVQATTMQVPGPPGKFEAVLVVRDQDGNQTDRQPIYNISNPFQDEAEALEAANDFLQRIDVNAEGKVRT